MDLRLRRLERRLAVDGGGTPSDQERLIRMQCMAYGHDWKEGWDDALKNIKGPVAYKGFYFHCARCDPNAEHRITDMDEIGDPNI